MPGNWLCHGLSNIWAHNKLTTGDGRETIVNGGLSKIISQTNFSELCWSWWCNDGFYPVIKLRQNVSVALIIDLDDVRVVTASLGAIFSHTNRPVLPSQPGLPSAPLPLLSHFLSSSSGSLALKIVGDLLDSGILSGHCEPCYWHQLHETRPL